MVRDDKGQVHTLEGFTAAFIVIFALLYGIQAIAITPTSSSTASQEVELYNHKIAGDVLDMSEANGDLKDAVLNWQNSTVGFNGSGESIQYYSGISASNSVPGDFGETLSALDKRGLVYNVDILCDGNTVPFINNGEESLHTVTASTTLQLQDYNEMANGDELEDGDYLAGNCGNVDEDSNLYNIIEVEMTVWRQ